MYHQATHSSLYGNQYYVQQYSYVTVLYFAFTNFWYLAFILTSSSHTYTLLHISEQTELLLRLNFIHFVSLLHKCVLLYVCICGYKCGIMGVFHIWILSRENKDQLTTAHLSHNTCVTHVRSQPHQHVSRKNHRESGERGGALRGLN